MTKHAVGDIFILLIMLISVTVVGYHTQRLNPNIMARMHL